MNLKRKEYYRTMLTRPINLQQPLLNLFVPASYPTLPTIQDSDLSSHFHQHFNVTTAPLSPYSKKRKNNHVVTQLFRSPKTKKSCSKGKKNKANPSEPKITSRLSNL